MSGQYSNLPTNGHVSDRRCARLKCERYGVGRAKRGCWHRRNRFRLDPANRRHKSPPPRRFQLRSQRGEAQPHLPQSCPLRTLPEACALSPRAWWQTRSQMGEHLAGHDYKRLILFTSPGRQGGPRSRLVKSLDSCDDPAGGPIGGRVESAGVNRRRPRLGTEPACGSRLRPAAAGSCDPNGSFHSVQCSLPARPDVGSGCAPCKGGAFQWV